jgi:hypothetical protein
MNSLEESIADILEAADKRIPEDKLARISEDVYNCQHHKALWTITKYLDPFDAVDYSLVVHSWDILCQYQQHQLEVIERINPERVENNKYLLKICEEGKKRAIRMKESRQHCEVISHSKQIRSFKAKCN